VCILAIVPPSMHTSVCALEPHSRIGTRSKRRVRLTNTQSMVSDRHLDAHHQVGKRSASESELRMHTAASHPSHRWSLSSSLCCDAMMNNADFKHTILEADICQARESHGAYRMWLMSLHQMHSAVSACRIDSAESTSAAAPILKHSQAHAHV
jgi:hypothetical protein